MATSPAGKKPAPRKTPPKKPAVPAKETAGKATPARKRSAAATAKPDPVPPKAAPAPRKPRSTIKKESAQDTPQLGLSAKQQKFVDEYLVDLNGAQAAIRAGYSPNTARQMGTENLSKPYIQLAIAEARKAQQERTQISADRVVIEAWNQMTADARDLVEVFVGCCRFCHGEGFKWQRTVAEFNKDRERHLIGQRTGKVHKEEDFDEQGGIGYSPLKPPHAGCPECCGAGAPRTVLKDTRTMSPQALALYAGAKMGKYGIEVQMHSKDAAMEKLFKHLGLYEKDNQQKTDPLSALLHRIAGGNANGFKPVQDDPESPTSGNSTGTNTLQPRQDIEDGDQD